MTKEEILSKLVGHEVYEQVKAVLDNSETLVNKVSVLQEEIEELEYENNSSFYSLAEFDIVDMIDHLECEGYTMTKENNSVILDYVDANLLEEINRLFYMGSFEQRQLMYEAAKKL